MGRRRAFKQRAAQCAGCTSKGTWSVGLAVGRPGSRPVGRSIGMAVGRWGSQAARRSVDVAVGRTDSSPGGRARGLGRTVGGGRPLCPAAVADRAGRSITRGGELKPEHSRLYMGRRPARSEHHGLGRQAGGRALQRPGRLGCGVHEWPQCSRRRPFAAWSNPVGAQLADGVVLLAYQAAYHDSKCGLALCGLPRDCQRFLPMGGRVARTVMVSKVCGLLTRAPALRAHAVPG